MDPGEPPNAADDSTEGEPQGADPEGGLLAALIVAMASRAAGDDANAKTEVVEVPGSGGSGSGSGAGAGEPVSPGSPSPPHSPVPLAQEYVRLLRRPGTAGVEAPMTLGRFEVIGVLGKGGFGTVYLAQDPRLQRCVALKVPHPEVILSPSARERFLREGRAAARLDHPAIVPVLEVEEPNPIGTIAYAYCPGPTLSKWLKAQSQPVPPRQAAALLATLADAVSHAHGRDILHRDIKPSNVILTGISHAREQVEASGEAALLPKLTDFGLARIVSEGGDDTRSGVPFGSPSYMAPEQAAGRVRQIGTWTDVYALGAVLYEVLTGRPPFRGDTLAETVLQVLGDQPVSPRALRPKIPRDLETIVLTCLQKQPSRRYASASALRDDLRRFLEGRPIAARPEWWTASALRWLRGRPLLFAGLIVAIILPAVLLGVMLAWNASLRALNTKLSDARDSAQASTVLAEQYLYGANLREAADALAGGQPERAQELLFALEATPAWGHSREFTWRYVRHAARRSVTLLSQPGENVEAVAVSGEGGDVVTVDRGGAVRLRDSRTGRLRWWVATRLSSEIRAAISRDASRIAVTGRELASGPRVLLLLEGKTGRVLGRHVLGGGEAHAVRFGGNGQTLWLLQQLPDEALMQVRLRCEEVGAGGSALCRETGHWRSSGELAVSADGLRVVRWGGPSGPLTVENAENGLVLWRAPQVPGELGRSALSGDGRRVAVVELRSDRHVLHIWDVDSGDEKGQYPASGEAFFQLSLSDDGAVLKGRQISGRTLVRGEGVAFEIEPIVGDPGRITGGASTLDPKGRTLASNQHSIAGGIHPMELYDVATGRVLSRFPGSVHRGNDAAYSADGRALAVRSGRRALSWRLDPEPDPQPPQHAVEAWSAAYTPDGRLLATGSDNVGESLTLRVCEVATGRQIAAWTAHPGTTAAMAMHPTQPLLATAGLSETENLRLWKIPSGELVADLPGNTNWLRALAFSPDGKYLAAGGNERVVRVYEMPSRRLWGTLAGATDKIRTLAFSPDSRQLAVGSNDGEVRLWDLTRGPASAPRVAAGEIMVAALAFSPDGKILAVGDEEGGLVIRDAASLTVERRIDTGCEELRCLAIAPDGPTLASPGEPGTLTLWDYETGQRLATLAAGPSKLQGLRFAPDGTSLTVCDHGGGVRLLRAPVPPRNVLERAGATP